MLNKKEIRIKLSSYDYRLLDQWVKKIIEISHQNNVTVKGPIPLPTDRQVFTFQRSPHVNKPSMEQFERRTHRRLIVVKDFNKNLQLAFKNLDLPASLLIDFKLVKSKEDK